MKGYHTVLFEGERVDAKTKTIAPQLDGGWFNFGCAGHALAKLELTAHTESAHRHGFDLTTIDQRTTMLKMLVADYTGTGMPFTIAGMPLSWADDKGWMTQSPNITKLEAAWTPSGAACLEAPRGQMHWSPALAAAFPDTNGDIELALGDARPRLCGDNNLDGFHLVTENIP